MSEETLPPIPGMQEKSSRRFNIIQTTTLANELMGLVFATSKYVDLLVDADTKRILVRLTPEDPAQIKLDAIDKRVVHIYGGLCYQVDDSGSKVSRAYECNGFATMLEINRDVGAGELTLNVPRKDEDL